MFYDKQPFENRMDYKQMLALMGSLSKLFSESDAPMLNYRAHENIFCKYFEATNVSREDCSVDASKGTVGIGLKTWVGRDDQKIAEFGRFFSRYERLSDIQLVRKISEYRNERIRVTMKIHGLNEMVYHIVKRVPNMMRIYEAVFEYIDLENIVLNAGRGSDSNIYFSDGKHTYHFSKTKNTLYMIFDDMVLLDTIDVNIANDPYELLRKLALTRQPRPITGYESVHLGMVAEPKIEYATALANNSMEPEYPKLCLRLYSTTNNGEKYVPKKSGLNQWNASGRERHPDEIYIPYPANDRKRDETFFPPKDTPFYLCLPDGTVMFAKVCQSAYPKMDSDKYNRLTLSDRAKIDKLSLVGKSIMSNPNRALGKWLLRDVFELAPNTVVTYEMLECFGIDSVIFTKMSDTLYKIDFAPLMTYEKMYGHFEGRDTVNWRRIE